MASPEAFSSRWEKAILRAIGSQCLTPAAISQATGSSMPRRIERWISEGRKVDTAVLDGEREPADLSRREKGLRRIYVALVAARGLEYDAIYRKLQKSRNERVRLRLLEVAGRSGDHPEYRGFWETSRQYLEELRTKGAASDETAAAEKRYVLIPVHRGDDTETVEQNIRDLMEHRPEPEGGPASS